MGKHSTSGTLDGSRVRPYPTDQDRGSLGALLSPRAVQNEPSRPLGRRQKVILDQLEEAAPASRYLRRSKRTLKDRQGTA